MVWGQSAQDIETMVLRHYFVCWGPSNKNSDPKRVKWKWKPIDAELFRLYRTLPHNSPTGEKVQCPICGYSCVSIRKHVRYHRAQYSKFACYICKFAAKSQKSLTYHLTIRHKELGLKRKVNRRGETGKRPECSICKHTYCNDHALREHLAFHKKYSKTSCPICHYPCVSEKNLKFHTKRYHSVSKQDATEGKKLPKWKCLQCSTSYQTNKQLREHLVTHPLNTSYPCPVCKFVFQSPQDLDNHLVTKHRPTIAVPKIVKKVVKIPCGECDFIAESQQQWNQHLKTTHTPQPVGNSLRNSSRQRSFKHQIWSGHENKVSKTLSCIAQGQRWLNQHFKTIDATRRVGAYKCDRCDYATNMSGFFKAHTKRHAVLDNAIVANSTNYCCKICSAKFSNSKSIANHFSRVHKSELSKDLLLCHQCDKTFVSDLGLHLHIQNTHVNKVLKSRRSVAQAKRRLNQRRKTALDGTCMHKCDRCKYVTYSSNRIKSHASTHCALDNASVDESTGIYCCKICSSKFDKRRSFFIHFSLSHKSKLTHDTFLCHCCHKTFVTERGLNRHIKNVHVNPAPKKQRDVACELCIRRFRTERELEEHKLLKHPIAPERSVCDHCGMSFSSVDTMNHHQRKFHPGFSKLGKSGKPASSASLAPPPEGKKCEHCDLICVNLKGFKDHLRTAHPHLYKFHCTLCPAKYISGSNLKLHMTSCHGQGKETCKWCGVKVKSYSMNIHMKKHCKQNPARNANPLKN